MSIRESHNTAINHMMPAHCRKQNSNHKQPRAGRNGAELLTHSLLLAIIEVSPDHDPSHVHDTEVNTYCTMATMRRRSQVQQRNSANKSREQESRSKF